jgi:hypothetical protein
VLTRPTSIGLLLATALALASVLTGTRPAIASAAPAATIAAAPRANAVCGARKHHPVRYRSVVVFAFENRTWSEVGGRGFRSMPYLASLARRCSYLTQWAETNATQDSLTQYIGATSGVDNPATVNDCTPSARCRSTDDNIFRQVRTTGRRAVNYVEDAPRPCSAGTNAVRHIPAMYYFGTYTGRSGATHNDHAACRSEVRPYRELDPRHLPAFAFVTPNTRNDGHDGATARSNARVDAWARANIGRVLQSHAYRAGHVAVFVWYDEDQPVPNLVIAPTAKPGPVAVAGAGAGSTLGAWEEMLGLPKLGNAATAPSQRAAQNV